MNSRSLLNMLLMVSMWCGSQAMAGGTLEPVGDGTQEMEFELKDLENQIHTLSGYRGKVVLVNFWASWCVSCIREFPSLERLSLASDASRFALLAINVREGRGTVQRFKRLQDSGVGILMDKNGSVAGDWGVKVYPTSFIIDANGVVRRKIIGETDWDSNKIHDYIQALLSADAAD